MISVTDFPIQHKSLVFSGGDPFRKDCLHASAVFPWVKELYVSVLREGDVFLILANNHLITGATLSPIELQVQF